jgi:hypothetical protein
MSVFERAPTSESTKESGGKSKPPESAWHRALPTAMPGHRPMASIDYVGAVAINVRARTVEFFGKIDQFPAFEIYGTANGDAGAIMFNIMPLPSKDPWNLARRGQSYAERLGDDLAMLRLRLPPLLLHATAHSSKNVWRHETDRGVRPAW